MIARHYSAGNSTLTQTEKKGRRITLVMTTITLGSNRISDPPSLLSSFQQNGPLKVRDEVWGRRQLTYAMKALGHLELHLGPRVEPSVLQRSWSVGGPTWLSSCWAGRESHWKVTPCCWGTWWPWPTSTVSSIPSSTSSSTETSGTASKPLVEHRNAKILHSTPLSANICSFSF